MRDDGACQTTERPSPWTSHYADAIPDDGATTLIVPESLHLRRQHQKTHGRPACLVLALPLLLCSACTLTSHPVDPATPERDRAVIFDIDGTLTKSVRAIHGTRAGAADAVRGYADAGYHIVYLSARSPWFQFPIPGWLERHGFPAGSIHVTEWREHRSDPEAFKRAILERYLAKGWTLFAAYGDSTTDFAAYASAGIPRNRVFALRRKDEANCEPGAWTACYSDWPEQMETIRHLIGTGD